MIRRRGVVTIDADWFHTCWSLTKSASDKIFNYCRERALSCGGGESTIRVRVKPKVWREIANFISKALDSPDAWKRISARPRYARDAVSNQEREGEWDFATSFRKPPFDEAEVEKFAARAALKPLPVEAA